MEIWPDCYYWPNLVRYPIDVRAGRSTATKFRRNRSRSRSKEKAGTKAPAIFKIDGNSEKLLVSLFPIG